MANVTLTVYDVARNATAVNITDNKVAGVSTNTYYAANDGRVKLVVMLTAASGNLIVETPGTLDGQAIGDLTIALTQNKQVIVGPFPPQYYNQADGTIKVTVSANTDVLAFRG